ncbi:MAG: AAA family ATPase [Rhizobium sp.]|nr:AAA family ATPase [Rhizobium sp.]
MVGELTRSGALHVRFDDFELDEANALLLRGGAAVALAPTPFGLLCALARRPGALMTKHVLLDTVWGHRFVSDSVLKGAVSEIRSALGDDPKAPRYIETVPRRGYRFVVEPVSVPVPTPAALSSSATRDVSRAGMAFVGREAEWAALSEAWVRACSGQRVIAWVAGEPGIGKTSLIDSFIAGAVNGVCARGQCVQGFGTGEPYHAVLEALGSLARHDESVALLLRTAAPTWLIQLPWLCSPEQRESLLRELVGVNPERMLREMGEFLDRYTEQRPLLLVTEDLHWADRATVKLIEYVSNRHGSCRLLWLSSFRLTEVVALDHPLDALRHSLRAKGACTEVVLDSFTRQEVDDLLRLQYPALASDETFAHELYERTEGVPLFVSAVAEEVVGRVGTGRSPSEVLADSPIPNSLSSLIEHHLSSLDPEGRALLRAAAISGAVVRTTTLSQVLERDALEVENACEALARDRSWLIRVPEEGGEGQGAPRGYAFRHAMYRQALIDRALPSVRVDLHRRVAAALQQERQQGELVPAAEIATHFEYGRLAGAALEYYAEAAHAALRQLSPAECLSLTGRALALLNQVPSGSERAEHELTLSTLKGVAAFHVFGAGSTARDAFVRAAVCLGAVPDHPMRGLLLHGLGFLLSLRAEYDDALVEVARAEALGAVSGDTLLAVAASTVQGQVHNVQGRPVAARKALERSLPLIESMGEAMETRLLGFIADPQVTARAMLALPLVHLGLVRQAQAHLEGAMDRARSLGQPMALMVSLWLGSLVAIRLEDVDRVAAFAEEMQALVDRYSLAQGQTACRWFLGWADAKRGRPMDGYRRIRDALAENVALGMVSGATETMGYAAEALLEAGDFEAARHQLDEAFLKIEQTGERIYLPQLKVIEATLERMHGNSAQAIAAARRALAESSEQGAVWLELQALVALGDCGGLEDADTRRLTELVDSLEEGRGTRPMDRAHRLLHKA